MRTRSANGWPRGYARSARVARLPRSMTRSSRGGTGLALIALSNVGRWLDEARYVESAQRAARFIVESCWDASSQTMLRGRRDGESLGEGFLEDYALPLLGLLRLHAADADPGWLEVAHQLGRAIVARFYDAELHTFHHSARRDIPEGLPLRRPDLDDGVLPSGGNAATLALIELGAMSGDRAMYEMGDRGGQRVRSAGGAISLWVGVSPRRARPCDRQHPRGRDRRRVGRPRHARALRAGAPGAELADLAHPRARRGRIRFARRTLRRAAGQDRALFAPDRVRVRGRTLASFRRAIPRSSASS